METTDISGYEDPLRVAEGLGRPMAIVRIGSRQPLPNELQEFAFYGPGTQAYAQPTQPAPAVQPAWPAEPPASPSVTPQNIPSVEPPTGSDTRSTSPAPRYPTRNTSYLQGRQR